MINKNNLLIPAVTNPITPTIEGTRERFIQTSDPDSCRTLIIYVWRISNPVHVVKEYRTPMQEKGFKKATEKILPI